MIDRFIDLTERRVFKDDSVDFDAHPYDNKPSRIPWKPSTLTDILDADKKSLVDDNDYIALDKYYYFGDELISDYFNDYDEFNFNLITSEDELNNSTVYNTYYTYSPNTTQTDLSSYIYHGSTSTSITNDYKISFKTKKDIFGKIVKPNIFDIEIDSKMKSDILKKLLIPPSLQRKFDKLQYHHKIPWNTKSKRIPRLIGYNDGGLLDEVLYRGRDCIDIIFSEDNKYKHNSVPWIDDNKHKNTNNTGFISLHINEDLINQLDNIDDEIDMPNDGFFVSGMRSQFERRNSDNHNNEDSQNTRINTNNNGIINTIGYTTIVDYTGSLSDRLFNVN